MKLPRVVLDTNVLVAGLRSRRGQAFKLLSLLASKRFEVCISVPMVFEYEDVLAREKIGVSADAANAVIDYLCAVARRQDVYFLWRPFLSDPKDDLVLELAVASGSSAIITYNVRDFAGIAQFNLRAMRPVEFLAELGVTP
jgi:putative PIN family toxin of toxin-antitoxin system